MTRTFVAIELGETARELVAREIARLGRTLPWVRWVDPASLHLTLAFLGELDDTQLAAVYAAAAEATPIVAPFALRIGGLGTFGPPQAPRVVWLGIVGDLPQLARLHQALAAALTARAFALDTRPFAAHLTLARLRTPPSAEQVAQLRALLGERTQRPAAAPGAIIEVRRLSVMRSELVRPVARYTCLRMLPLGARSP